MSYGTQQIFQALSGLMMLVAYVVVAWLLSAVTTAAVVLCGIVLVFGLSSQCRERRAGPFLRKYGITGFGDRIEVRTA